MPKYTDQDYEDARRINELEDSFNSSKPKYGFKMVDTLAVKTAQKIREANPQAAELADEIYRQGGVQKRKTSDGIIEYRNKARELHREDGPAMINTKTGEERWYRRGFLHRDGAPALIRGKYRVWWQAPNRHRLDGPAVIDGRKREWWVRGARYYYDIVAYLREMGFEDADDESKEAILRLKGPQR